MGRADEIFGEQFFHEQIGPHSKRRRTKHRHQLGKTFRRCQHLFRFGQVHRHPGLTKNVFASFERGNRHSRMHIRRRADPDDVEIGQGKEIGPIRHRRRAFTVFLAKLVAALVSRVRNGHDLDVGIFFQGGQMPGANDIARADDSDPQFTVIFLCHVSNADADLALRITIARAKFDRHI